MSTFNSHNLADPLEQDITKLDKVYKTIIHVNLFNLKKLKSVK